MRGLTGLAVALLMLLLGVGAISGILLAVNKNVEITGTAAIGSERKLLEKIEFPPQISNIIGISEDNRSAVVEVVYYGTEPIDLKFFRLYLVGPNGEHHIVVPDKILKAEDCLTADNKKIKPGAYCLFLVNLSKVYPPLDVDFMAEGVGVAPLLGNASDVRTVKIGNIKGITSVGDLATIERGVVVKFPREVKITRIFLGGFVNFVLLSNGSVYCWGRNDRGQLGLGDTANRLKPVIFPHFDSFEIDQITPARGFHTCALLKNRSVYCWGDNVDGQLGLGYTSYREIVPKAVEALEGKNITKIVAGNYHTCALAENGSVYCWGWNGYGQLGLGDTTDRYTPTAVTALEGKGVIDIVAGLRFTCALLSNGTVYCWGDNLRGQLGLGDTANRNLPAAVKALDGKRVVKLNAGNYHTCALLDNGSVYCWGYNGYGQLGLGDTANRNLPAAVTALEDMGVVEIKSGGAHNIAILSNRSVVVWGRNDNHGQLGLGDFVNRLLPVNHDWLNGVLWTEIDTGIAHVCVAVPNNTLFCWGDNSYGQIGVGSTETVNYEYPKEVIFEIGEEE